jgi:hypothetical protein
LPGIYCNRPLFKSFTIHNLGSLNSFIYFNVISAWSSKTCSRIRFWAEIQDFVPPLIERNINKALCGWPGLRFKQGAGRGAILSVCKRPATRFQPEIGQPRRGGPLCGLARRCVRLECGRHTCASAPSARPQSGPPHRALFMFRSMAARNEHARWSL